MNLRLHLSIPRHVGSRWEFTGSAVISLTNIFIFCLRAQNIQKLHIISPSSSLEMYIIFLFPSKNAAVKDLVQGHKEVSYPENPEVCLLSGSFPQNTAPMLWAVSTLVIQVHGVQISYHLFQLSFSAFLISSVKCLVTKCRSSGSISLFFPSKW